MAAPIKVVLPSVYLGPIQWYSCLPKYDWVAIEHFENYRKQTYRNRCRIIGANGIQDLIVPVHTIGNHTPMHEVRIDYDGNWQRQHWQSIRSAYGNSPFFDFYADYFSPFYHEKKWEKLIDFNQDILSLVMKLMKLDSKITFTEYYDVNHEDGDFHAHDFRDIFSPKSKSEVWKHFPAHRYTQVFEERHGFVPYLSIIDLLCCCGPQSHKLLFGGT